MELKAYLHEKAAQVDQALHALLPQEDLYPATIHQAMRYSIFAGGKRLRPILCLAGIEAVGEDSASYLPVACALEMVHTYSLIHDDLPAMDNDDYRRGKLTCHKVFDEAIAILAGDALLTQAFESLADFGLARRQPELVLKAIKEIAWASGAQGMIGGQVVDLQCQGSKGDKDTLIYMHAHKTGALFQASLRVGALLAGAEDLKLQALKEYAEGFGLAFQITDDLLDIEGTQEKIGKPVGSDVKNAKFTYPLLFGMQESRRLAEEAIEQALKSLHALPGNTKPLKLLAQYVLERES